LRSNRHRCYSQADPSSPWEADGFDFPVLYEVDGTAVAPFVLQVNPMGHQIILSWPSSANNYVLETSPSLSPGASWIPITNDIVAGSSVFVLTNNADASAGFFGLHAAADNLRETTNRGTRQAVTD